MRVKLPNRFFTRFPRIEGELHAALDPLWLKETKARVDTVRPQETVPKKEDNVSNETEMPRSTAPAQAVLGRRDAADFIGQVFEHSPVTEGDDNGLKRTKIA